jgi:asparagine synthase (glutamine-hydrolysing)
MCGILGIFGSTKSQHDLRQLARASSGMMKHRGPDWCGTKVMGRNAIAHERLAIVDPESGEQPLISENGSILLAVNGEIYNHLILKAGMLKGAYFSTGSDCEVIIPLYEKLGSSPEAAAQICGHLDGVFAFVLYDAEKDIWMAGRDPIGVNPLYMGWAKDGAVCFASELKALHTTTGHDGCQRIVEFPPGCCMTSAMTEPMQWYKPVWYDEKYLPSGKLDFAEMRAQFEKAVVKRMMSDVPWGVLLSGGLDSSLVASIASRHAKYRTEDYKPGAGGMVS